MATRFVRAGFAATSLSLRSEFSMVKEFAATAGRKRLLLLSEEKYDASGEPQVVLPRVAKGRIDVIHLDEP